MAVYEVQAVHVRWWRGQAKRWTTRWTFSGSWSGGDADLDAFSAALQPLCYAPSTTPNAYGGLAELRLYNRTAGGSPVATRTYFDWSVPASWIGYSGAVWTPRTSVPEGGGEIAMQLYYPAGLSKSGKPVRYRKWIHAVPGTDVSSGAAQINPTQITALQAQANAIPGCLGAHGLAFGDGVRIPGTAVVLPYYGAHQLVRGRRRKILTTKQTNSLFQQIVNAGISSTSSQPGLA